MSEQPKEIPFTLENFDDFCASLLSYELRVTERRFNQVAGELVEVKKNFPCIACSHETENPEYAIAQFGEAEFTPAIGTIWRVQKVTILFARMLEPGQLQPCG